MRQIEIVDRGVRVHVNGQGGLRQWKWQLVVKFSDGTEQLVWTDGRCVAFIETGFLVAYRREWLFYDVDLKKVAVVSKDVLGDCVGVSYDFYSFSDQDGDFAVDCCGKRIGWPHPWVEIPVDEAFRRGMSYLRMENFNTH